MSYKVATIHTFDRQIKRLIRKYPSLKEDISKLASELKENPNKGTPLGKDCYKIRIAVKSKGKGKSGGARVITLVLIADTTVFLLFIYDKSEQGSITKKEIEELLKEVDV